MYPHGPDLTCSRCSRFLKDNVCINCRLVHCPFCGSTVKQGCAHILADWEGLGGKSDHFQKYSPILTGTPPFLSVKRKRVKVPVARQVKKRLGKLAPLLTAYRHNFFKPPNPVVLFQSLVKMISMPCVSAAVCAPGMAAMGGHLFWFAQDVDAAKAEITSILFELHDRINDIERHLKPRPRKKTVIPPDDPTIEWLVYGKINEDFVFAKKEIAEYFSACHDALRTSKTWGEFRVRIKPEDYSEIVDRMAGTDFAAFCREQREDHPEASVEDLLIQYLELSVGERPPLDHDPFHQSMVPGVDDGDWPGWLAQKMLDWVPKEIQEEYGEVIGSMFNGDCLSLCNGSACRIAAAFRRAGYRCVRDDTLMLRACGYEV